MSSFNVKQKKAKHNSVLNFSDASQMRRSSIGGGSSKSSHIFGVGGAANTTAEKQL